MGMFRRQPSDAGHAQHDGLLIAQYAARDPLTEAQVAQAAALVAACAECSSLAADLGAISQAVAAEIVPPRRRDFRIDAETAAGLRGNPLQRLMRRLAMPSAAPLPQVAAGVMSLGLVLVIAGNVLPSVEEGVAEPPAALTQTDVSSDRIDEDRAGLEPMAPDAVERQELGVEEPVSADETSGSVVAGVEDDGPKRGSGDELDVSARLRAPDPATDPSAGVRSEVNEDRRDQIPRDVAAEAVDATGGGAESEDFADDLAPGHDAFGEFRSETDESALKSVLGDATGEYDSGQDAETTPSLAAVAPVTSASGPPDAGRLAAGQDATAAADGASTIPTSGSADDPASFIDTLVPLGILLVIVGFLALALVWLSRRLHPDPVAG